MDFQETTSKHINLRNKLCDAHQEMEPKAEVPQTEKLLMQQLSNRTCTGIFKIR